MPARRLLVATYYFPPDQSVGSRRWDAMAAWLRHLGHEVTVLTTRAWGIPMVDEAWIVRTGDLVASRTLRRLLARPSLPAAGKGIVPEKQAPLVLTEIVVPDGYLLSWVLAAVPVARRLIRDRAIDCLVTSGPPQSTHVLGLLLGRSRPAWIADFRDGWRHEMLREPWPTKAQERIDATLERRVVAAADRVVGVTRPIAEDFSARLGSRAVHIPNGWDPRIDAGLSDQERPALDRGFVNVVHTGRLSGFRGRDPKPLFDAIDLLRQSHPEAAARLRIVLAGRLDAAETEMLDRLQPSATIVHLGYLDRNAAAAIQRDADALLLLTSLGHASVATGKLFEYLTAGRPIIALAEGNEAARIVAETGTGTAVRPDDPHAIALALLAAVDGRLARDYAPRDLGRYIYPSPAEEFAAEIERVLHSRSRA
jgi:glycosyltransferase involved in cell wall biosynthesis